MANPGSNTSRRNTWWFHFSSFFPYRSDAPSDFFLFYRECCEPATVRTTRVLVWKCKILIRTQLCRLGQSYWDDEAIQNCGVEGRHTLLDIHQPRSVPRPYLRRAITSNSSHDEFKVVVSGKHIFTFMKVKTWQRNSIYLANIRYVKCVCGNINCAQEKRSLHSRWICSRL